MNTGISKRKGSLPSAVPYPHKAATRIAETAAPNKLKKIISFRIGWLILGSGLVNSSDVYPKGEMTLLTNLYGFDKPGAADDTPKNASRGPKGEQYLNARNSPLYLHATKTWVG